MSFPRLQAILTSHLYKEEIDTTIDTFQEIKEKHKEEADCYYDYKNYYKKKIMKNGKLRSSAIPELKKMYGPIEIPPALDWSVATDLVFARPWRWLICDRFAGCKKCCACETKFHRRYRLGTSGVENSMIRNMDIIQFIKRMRKTTMN